MAFMKHTTLVSTALVTILVLSGCGSATPTNSTHAGKKQTQDIVERSNDGFDPLEALNRGIFAVNEVLDGVLLKPLTHIYRGIMPEPAQTGVKNVLNNLSSPVVTVNSLLQGDGKNTLQTVGRFAVNSTVGIAGIFDVAKEIGLEKHHKKDFGQTLGVWGVGNGPYLMLPILGPSNVRDTVGMVADVAMDPFTYIFTTPESLARAGVNGIVKRDAIMPLTDRVYRDSFDPYSTFRSSYTQYRAKVVSNYLGADANIESMNKK